jgi:low affinity Fe/Cu permease
MLVVIPMIQDPRTPRFSKRISSFVDSFATRSAQFVGSHWAFALALALVLIWIVIGSNYRYSDGSQLVINTATNVLASIIIFLIQNTQNRDSAAAQRKLDHILRSLDQLHTSRQLDTLNDQELKRLTVQVRNEWGRRRALVQMGEHRVVPSHTHAEDKYQQGGKIAILGIVMPEMLMSSIPGRWLSRADGNMASAESLGPLSLPRWWKLRSLFSNPSF